MIRNTGFSWQSFIFLPIKLASSAFFPSVKFKLFSIFGRLCETTPNSGGVESFNTTDVDSFRNQASYVGRYIDNNFSLFNLFDLIYWYSYTCDMNLIKNKITIR